MKKLIKRLSYAICILLLTCTFCLAQIEFKNDSIQEVIRVNYDSAKVKVGGAELLTIKMIVEYSDECFNDSTRLYEWSCWEGMGFESTWLKEGQTPYNCECHVTDSILYMHKQPDFADFVRWVARKYGL